VACGFARREPHLTTRRSLLLPPLLVGTSVVFRTPGSRPLCSDDVCGPRVPGLTVSGLRPDAGACANTALFGGRWYGGFYSVPLRPSKRIGELCLVVEVVFCPLVVLAPFHGPNCWSFGGFWWRAPQHQTVCAKQRRRRECGGGGGSSRGGTRGGSGGGRSRRGRRRWRQFRPAPPLLRPATCPLVVAAADSRPDETLPGTHVKRSSPLTTKKRMRTTPKTSMGTLPTTTRRGPRPLTVATPPPVAPGSRWGTYRPI